MAEVTSTVLQASTESRDVRNPNSFSSSATVGNGWWTPPCHKTELECLTDTSDLKELEEHRRSKPELFLDSLKDYGCCCMGDQDLLSCFENEEGLQPRDTRRANYRHAAGAIGVESPAPDHDEVDVWLMETSLSTYFYHCQEWCHLVVHPSSESDDFQRHMSAIAVEHSTLKEQFEASNKKARQAVRRSDWETACEGYEDCLTILESMKTGLRPRIHTWLLLWVCIPLVHMYQLWRKNLHSKCVTIYNRMLQQLNRMDENEDAAALGKLYYEILWHRRLVLFEWSHDLDPKEADGDHLSNLFARYVRWKALSAVSVQNEEAQGSVVLQKMMTQWGKRCAGQCGATSCERDVRVAFCFNLERLFNVSQQWSPKLVQWVRMKWLWINSVDESEELTILRQIRDVQPLYEAGMIDDADHYLKALVKKYHHLENYKKLDCACKKSNPNGKELDCDCKKHDRWELRLRLLYEILCWDGRLLAISNPREAEILFKEAIKELENQDSKGSSGALLAVNEAYSPILRSRIGGDRIWEDSPFSVEGSRNAAVLTDGDTKFFEEVHSSSMRSLPKQGSPEFPLFEMSRGDQLIFLANHSGLAKAGGWRDLYSQAMKAFETSLRYLNLAVHTLQRTSWLEIQCNRSLGLCFLWTRHLKESEYSKEFNDELPEYNECHMNSAIEYFQKALQLAERYGNGHLVQHSIKLLGTAHFYKADALFSRVWGLIFGKDNSPEVLIYWNLISAWFCGPFCGQELFCRLDNSKAAISASKSTIRVELQEPCRNPNHMHCHYLTFAEGEVSYAICQGLKGSKADDAFYFDCDKESVWTKTMKIRRPVEDGGLAWEWNIESIIENLFAFCSKLLDDLLMEVKESARYLRWDFEMDAAAPFCELPKDGLPDGQVIIDLGLWSSVEITKVFFSRLQLLQCFEFFIKYAHSFLLEAKKMVLHGGPQKSSGAEPFQRLVQHDPDQDLTLPQKGLLWSERGRSRILMHQLLLADKSLKNSTEKGKLVKFGFTDKEAWEILRRAQRACGKNTVFVAYSFDTSSREGSKSVISIVYVVQKDGIVHMRDFPWDWKVEEDIQASLKMIHDALSNPKAFESKPGNIHQTIQNLLEDLYNLFIKPISDLLKDMEPADKLIFVLDDILTNVPFAILKERDVDNKVGKYLIQNHTISFSPSLRVLAQCLDRLDSMDQTSRTVQPSVALGDPAYLNWRRDKLKHTREEVTKVSPFFNSDSVKVLTCRDASIEKLLEFARLRDDEFQGFVHVAAHGLMNDKNRSGSLMLAHPKSREPPQSRAPGAESNRHFEISSDPWDEGEGEGEGEGAAESDEVDDATDDDMDLHNYERLGLGGVRSAPYSARSDVDPRLTTEEKKTLLRDRDGGILRSEQIINCGFEWRSRMVVLSACNTAKGYVLKSENVVGLPRAFLVAGVPCVVASQWKIPDKASSELMVEFYKEMSQGRDTATALRAAMLRMMQREERLGSKIVDSIRQWGGFLVWGLPTVTMPPPMLRQ